MDEKESNLQEIKAQLLLKQLQSREQLLKQARGRKAGYAYWTSYLAGSMLIGLGFWDLKGASPGIGPLILGLIFVLGAQETRLNSRIDAIIKLLSAEAAAPSQNVIQKD